MLERDREDMVTIYRFDFEKEFGVGEYVLHLEYSGPIRTGLQGVYLNRSGFMLCKKDFYFFSGVPNKSRNERSKVLNKSMNQ